MTYRLVAAIVYTFALTVCVVGTAYDYATPAQVATSHQQAAR